MAFPASGQKVEVGAEPCGSRFGFFLRCSACLIALADALRSARFACFNPFFFRAPISRFNVVRSPSVPPLL